MSIPSGQSSCQPPPRSAFQHAIERVGVGAAHGTEVGRTLVGVGGAPRLAPWAIITGSGIASSIGQPALDVGEVVQDLVVRQRVGAHQVVVAIQRVVHRSVCVPGVVDEADAWVFTLQLLHHGEPGVDLGCGQR